MERALHGRPTRFLDPIDRLSEVLFGLIMVLTFTGSLSVAESGREDVRSMLIAALGCNLAWGIIDGVLYLMGCVAERNADVATARAVRRSATREDAHRLIAGALPADLGAALGARELEVIRVRLVEQPEPPTARLERKDWIAALGVLLWVFGITFPVVIPFIVMHDPRPAMRVSNGIAIALLYATGHAYGRLTGRSPYAVGFGMVLLGVLLVGLTMALGG